MFHRIPHCHLHTLWMSILSSHKQWCCPIQSSCCVHIGTNNHTCLHEEQNNIWSTHEMHSQHKIIATSGTLEYNLTGMLFYIFLHPRCSPPHIDHVHTRKQHTLVWQHWKLLPHSHWYYWPQVSIQEKTSALFTHEDHFQPWRRHNIR